MDPRLGAYLVIMGAATFAAAVVDKRRAQDGRRRIRERTLLWLAFLGGSPGLLVAMMVVHHKVAKPTFLASFLLVVLIQATVVAILAFSPW